MKTVSITIVALLVGAAVGYGVAHQGWAIPSASSGDKQPLYWVAPMDPNYKRSGPGKSPMGMDLIPVYEEDLAAANNNDPAGTISVSAAIEQSLGVSTTSAELGQLAPKIATVGYVAFDESTLWQINSRVAGWVSGLQVNSIGDEVKAGQTLFNLYSPELMRAQEELLNAQRLGRAELVRGAKERLSTLGVDETQIAQIARGGVTRSQIAIKAPADGVIAALNVRNGGYLSPAQVVLSAGAVDRVWVEAEVFERQGHWLNEGDEALMQVDALPGKKWQGRVDRIYPILDAKTRAQRVRVVFANPDGKLKPNMFANLQLLPRSTESVLLVPENAVIRAGNMTRVVLALGEGKFRSARIEIGRSAGGFVEVLAGLQQGMAVVTRAQFLLDSESSQNADFSRIETPAAPVDLRQQWVAAQVVSLDNSNTQAKIRHEAIAAWKWPAMTMDFAIAEDVELSALVAQPIYILIAKSDSGYRVIAAQQDAPAQLNSTQLDNREGSATATAMVNQVWAQGQILKQHADGRRVSVSHQAINQWKWPAMTMDFTLAPQVDASAWLNQDVELLLEKTANGYQIVQIRARATEAVDHAAMGH